MAADRLISMSLAAALAGALVVLPGPVQAASRVDSLQEPSVKALYEAGKNTELLQAVQARREAGNDDPEATYLAALAFERTENTEGARNELAHLQDVGDQAWQLIAQAEVARLDDNNAAAREAARRATEANSTHPWAQYELGLVAAHMNDYAAAARAFERALELRPDLAYAHYYAGQAFQRERNLGKTAEHFQAFLKMAPEAPERPAVLAVLRTLK
ncbi:MAG: tetratricopeptide repeat protein [Vicinamibacterales bacterium]